MTGVDVATGTMTVPIWAAGAATAVFVVAVVLAIGRIGAAAAAATMFRVAIVLVAVYFGWLYAQRSTQLDQAAERRSLDERSAALMARAVAPGSALSCLDEVAGETVEAACERAVFASPEAIAAAVNYVAAKLALLTDGTQHAQRVDASFAAELVPLRTALELDRFGLVAHVLAQRDGCSIEQCDALSWLQDSSHVLAHLREHSFEAEVARYTPMWNSVVRAAPDGPVLAAVGGAIPGNPTPAPGTVAPRYDFPSSQSIPPVNIMAPETRAQGGQAPIPSDANAQAITPVPPRRPPQTRATPSPLRPAAVRPEPLPPAGDPSGDVTAPRAAAPAPVAR